MLHSGHFSKIFRKLMGTTCNLKWREAGERERLWVVEPGHPIVEGMGEYFEIPHTEMYGERFDIPAPDELVFVSWFQGGEVFRSGCCFHRGKGKIFYFRPGHETFPIYYQPEVKPRDGERGALGGTGSQPEGNFRPSPDPDREDRLEEHSMPVLPEPTAGDTSWFVHDRFGLFIHWGTYSLAARHEWVKQRERIPTRITRSTSTTSTLTCTIRASGRRKPGMRA